MRDEPGQEDTKIAGSNALVQDMGQPGRAGLGPGRRDVQESGQLTALPAGPPGSAGAAHALTARAATGDLPPHDLHCAAATLQFPFSPGPRGTPAPGAMPPPRPAPGEPAAQPAPAGSHH